MTGRMSRALPTILAITAGLIVVVLCIFVPVLLLLRLDDEPDMRAFWSRSRQPRVAITDGDDAEDTFTAEVDAAYTDTIAP